MTERETNISSSENRFLFEDAAKIVDQEFNQLVIRN